MATLPSKRWPDFVSDMVSTFSVQLGLSPVFQSGDIVLALIQSVAAQLVFIQAQAQLVNNVARAQTSTGADLDTFYGQFNFTRLPGTSATGQELFSAAVPVAAPILIPIGTIVQTPGGAVQYQVVADTTNPAYNSSTGAYTLGTGSTSILVTIQALLVGLNQNVSANQLSQTTGLLPGIVSVTNPAAISNGLNAESDAAFTVRWLLWVNSLSRAIKMAIQAAIESVQQGLIYNILENMNFFNQTMAYTDDFTFGDAPRLLGFPALHFEPGNFFVVIDDGSGHPPSILINKVYNAIDAIRGFTIRFEVFAPIVVTVNVSLTIQTAPATNHANVVGLVQVAIASYINSLSVIVSSLPLTRLAQVAYDASPLVIGVPLSSIKINNQVADLVLNTLEVPRAGTIAVI